VRLLGSRYVSSILLCLLLLARPALADEPASAANVTPAAAPKLPPDENPAAGYIPGYRRAIGLGLAPRHRSAQRCPAC